MIDSIQHIVFSTAAAVTLRKALRRLGRNESVIALTDDLSVGPVIFNAPEQRALWIKAELFYPYQHDALAKEKIAESAVLAGDHHRIIWFSRRSARDHAAFIALVAQLSDLPCGIVDLTDTIWQVPQKDGRAPHPRLIATLADLPPSEIIAQDLRNTVFDLTPEHRTACKKAWQTLAPENAALRILNTDKTLISAPISFFDEALCTAASHHWWKSARLICDVLGSWERVGLFQTDTRFLAARLKALVKAGTLEGVGNLSRILYSEIRLPPATIVSN